MHQCSMETSNTQRHVVLHGSSCLMDWGLLIFDMPKLQQAASLHGQKCRGGQGTCSQSIGSTVSDWQQEVWDLV